MSNVTDFAARTDAEAEKPDAMPAPTEEPTQADPFDDAPEGDNKSYPAAAKLINEVEAEQAKVDSINEKAKKEKAPHQDAMSVLKKRIKDEHGIESKALALVLAKRRQTRRIEEREKNLDENQSNQFRQLELAM